MVGLLASHLSITGLLEAEPSDFCGGNLARPALDHTDNTRLPSVEPEDIHPPGCGPYARGRASSSYLHLLTYNRQISFMVLTVLKSK